LDKADRYWGLAGGQRTVHSLKLSSGRIWHPTAVRARSTGKGQKTSKMQDLEIWNESLERGGSKKIRETSEEG